MTQTLRGRVIRNDNISVGNACGTENAVAVGVAAPTTDTSAPTTHFGLLEKTTIGSDNMPYGIEKYGSAGTTAPNPERVQSGT